MHTTSKQNLKKRASLNQNLFPFYKKKFSTNDTDVSKITKETNNSISIESVPMLPS